MVDVPVTAAGEPPRTAGDGSEAETPDDGTDAGDALDDDRAPAEVVDDIDRPVLLFDGVCNLCNGTIRAVVRLDRDGAVLFAPLQSDVGEELLERVALSTEYFDSVVLAEPPGTGAATQKGGWTASTKSEAVLRVCRWLDGPVPLLSVLAYLPEDLRDGVYDLVAEHRYRIFGRQDECPIPDERTRERFVERSLA
jgi:predicted DCC family thiol-disulfide oxidoreductase YuxK